MYICIKYMVCFPFVNFPVASPQLLAYSDAVGLDEQEMESKCRFLSLFVGYSIVHLENSHLLIEFSGTVSETVEEQTLEIN